MTKLTMALIAIFAVLIITVGTLFIWGVSLNNSEVTLRTSIENKITTNTADFDNMKKIIIQNAQVSEKEAEVLRDLIVGYAEARGGSGSSGGLGGMISVKVIQESVPSITSIETLRNLQNIITSERNKWTLRQKELVDFKREHDMLLRKFPGVILFSILNRKEMEIPIITSESTQEAFETGQDNDTKLF